MKSVDGRSDASERRSRGRPSRQQALDLTERIIDIAVPLFLAGGYETTSIDAIVATASISKRTFYARFESKEALFSAVIRRRMDDLLAPAARIPSESMAIWSVLIQVGAELTRRSLTPTAIAVDRLVFAEARQFPLLATVYKANADHVRALIADLFRSAMAKGEIRTMDALFLAEQFQHAVIDGPSRALRADPGREPSEAQWRSRLVAAVDLFLAGCAARPLE